MKLLSSNFVNRVKTFFGSKPKNTLDNVKTERQVRRAKDTKSAASFFRDKPKVYGQYGCMGRDLRAIYYPKSRGKIKGYMK